MTKTKETLTATQLRNARKRRAKQQKKGAADVEQQNGTHPATAAKRQKTQQQQQHDGCCIAAGNNSHTTTLVANTGAAADPSLRYAANPKAAPVVVAAKRFFARQQKQSKSNRLIPFPVYVGETTGWRTLAKLAVRNTGTASKQLLTIGLFAPKSHDLVPADNCPVHHPAINAAVCLIQEQARRLRIAAFAEATGTGQLRHVALAVQRHTGAVQLTFVWNTHHHHNNNKSSSDGSRDDNDNESLLSATKRDASRLVDALIAASNSNSSSTTKKKQHQQQQGAVSAVVWHSIWVHYNSSWKHANAIFSHTGKWEMLYHQRVGGSSAHNMDDSETADCCPMGGITEYLLDCGCCPVPVPLHFPPQVFRQGNLTAFATIVAAIRGYMIQRFGNGDPIDDDGDDSRTPAAHRCLHRPPRCLELYGGVGTIGLHVADLCQSLVSSDENPHNVACFEASARSLLENLKQLRGETKQALPTIHYQPVSASKMVELGAHQNVDVIIVDPPRKGLEDSVSAALAANNNNSCCKTLIYVSCGFDAFQRDFNILVNGPGGWKLDRAEGHILFPGSDAIETLAFFTR